jgi:hypothetical protein
LNTALAVSTTRQTTTTPMTTGCQTVIYFLFLLFSVIAFREIFRFAMFFFPRQRRNRLGGVSVEGLVPAAGLNAVANGLTKKNRPV